MNDRQIALKAAIGIACCLLGLRAHASLSAGEDMQEIDGFAIDRTEVTVGQFRRFVQATRFVSRAEKEGGGFTWDGGWRRIQGWTWKAPYGKSASDDEPAVHLSWQEAREFCEWAGKRLPTDAEWVKAAYTEYRTNPPPPFNRGKTYLYPAGDTAEGANYCDRRCENSWRDNGYDDGFAVHAPARRTRAGVNGLWDMGGNVWEWVQDSAGAEKRTRGGSWWYGKEQMRTDHLASKDPEFYAVYVGFRCARDLPR